RPFLGDATSAAARKYWETIDFASPQEIRRKQDRPLSLAASGRMLSGCAEAPEGAYCVRCEL
ncbi:MAG TPA: hypothetical protein VEC58_06690, partial [Roseiarcus sp.]|nr:hypothetical protein [Roseiarcus sp.]